MKSTNNDLFLISVQLNEALKFASEQDRWKDVGALEKSLLCILKRLHDEGFLFKKEVCSWAHVDDFYPEGLVEVLFHLNGYEYAINSPDLGKWMDE